ncbi:hypothetical protein [Kitasatospora acidiphila]|uniref:hypothetical protein n=1 Tax=Kitasatospora acidiphila TaxID=2567942 RepID=UPI003C744066
MAQKRGTRPGPGQRQLPAGGWVVRGGGLLLRVVGMIAVVAGLARFRAAGANSITGYGPPLWQSLLIGGLLFILGTVAVFGGGRLSRLGRRHTARIIQRPEELADRSYVLYLRPFYEDRKLYEIRRPSASQRYAQYGSPVSRTWEELLVTTFRRYGRVVAVGQPGERLPLPGAERFYLPLDDWQSVVSDLIRRARLVVLVAGDGPGTLWELTETVRLLPPEQLVLPVYDDEDGYERFRASVPQAFADRVEQLGADARPAPAFPKYPPDHRPGIRVVGGMRGIVHFDPDWTPRFVRFDLSAVRARTAAGRARKAGRLQVAPLLTRIEQRLPPRGA